MQAEYSYVSVANFFIASMFLYPKIYAYLYTLAGIMISVRSLLIFIPLKRV